MPSSHDVRLEAHGHAATLYLHELLSMERVIRAAALCEGLPREVRRLRVDLRTVRIFDPEGFAWLAHILADWRDRRGAHVRFDFADRFRRGSTIAELAAMRVPGAARSGRCVVHARSADGEARASQLVLV